MRKRRNLASRLLYLLIILLLVAAVAGAWYFFGETTLLSWANSPGVQWGVLAGVVAGAVVWPLVRDSNVTGSALLGAILGLLGVGFYQALQLGVLINTGSGVMTPEGAPILGAFALETVIFLLYAVFGGALLVLLVMAPQDVLVGGVLGFILGAAVGGISRPLMLRQGVDLSRELFTVIVGIVVLSIFSTLGSRET